MENSFAHQNSGTPNPYPRNDTAFLLCPSDKSTWTSHLYSLRDAPTKCPARLFLMVGQQPAESAVGASSRRIFSNAAQWREHTSANIKHVPVRLGLAHPGIQMQLGIDLRSRSASNALILMRARSSAERSLSSVNTKGRPTEQIC